MVVAIILWKSPPLRFANKKTSEKFWISSQSLRSANSYNSFSIGWFIPTAWLIWCSSPTNIPSCPYSSVISFSLSRHAFSMEYPAWSAAATLCIASRNCKRSVSFCCSRRFFFSLWIHSGMKIKTVTMPYTDWYKIHAASIPARIPFPMQTIISFLLKKYVL